MRELKIVKNPINDRFVVVEMNENAFSCPIASGRTRSEAMRNGFEVNKFCQQVSKEPVEDVLIHFDI